MTKHQNTQDQLAHIRLHWVVNYAQRTHRIPSPHDLPAGTVTNDGFDLLRSTSFASGELASYFSKMPRHQVTGRQLDCIRLHWVVNHVQRPRCFSCPTQLPAGVIDNSDFDRR